MTNEIYESVNTTIQMKALQHDFRMVLFICRYFRNYDDLRLRNFPQLDLETLRINMGEQIHHITECELQ